MSTIETCDFCYKTTDLGCSGVGPETEIGCIEVMSICPACELASLQNSIPRALDEIKEFKLKEMNLGFSDYEQDLLDYIDTKERLGRYYCEQLHLVEKVNTHYVDKYPEQVHPLNKSMEESLQTGVYTKCVEGSLSVNINLTTSQDRLIAQEYISALGIIYINSDEELPF